MFEPISRSWPPLRGAASRDKSRRASPEGLRVLLAEDTPICVEMMQAMASHLKFELDAATNGLDAIAMVQKAEADGRPYSLLLLDMIMPILDGVETARRLRSAGFSPETLPIIAVTAATDIDEVRTYRKAGIQAFLEKPVGIEDLKATLNAWGHRTSPSRRPIRSSAPPALQEKFEQRKLQTLTRLEATIEDLRFDEEIVLELRTMLHQIAGTAGSFGDKSLGDIMRSCEGELIARYFRGEDVSEVLIRARDELRRSIPS